jgi:hypothetical protein
LFVTKSPLPAGALIALEEALKALGRANAADTTAHMRAQMGRAVLAIDTALEYHEVTAYEVGENKKLPH